MTLDDWTKLLDVALSNTQQTCVTLTEVPESAESLLQLISVAQTKAQAAGLELSRLEVPSDRYEAMGTFAGVVGETSDVVRLTFTAPAAPVHSRRIVLPGRNNQSVTRPAAPRDRWRERRGVGMRRSRDLGPARSCDVS